MLRQHYAAACHYSRPTHVMMPNETEDKQPNRPFSFAGFHTPHYTQVPDQLFDELLPLLSGAEMKALLYICRRTFGFKKDSDNISINQMLNGIRRKDGTWLDRGAGLSKPTLLRALKGLKAKRIIVVERRQNADEGNLATNYRLHIQDTLGQEVNQAESQSFTTPLVSEIDQQQETEKQDTAATLADQLLGFGIDKPTVVRLLKAHDHQLIAQKIDYVVFMEESQIAKVKNPRGWLLKAIEQDYGPPAGYRPRAVREAHKAQVQQRLQDSANAEAQRRQSSETLLRQKQDETEALLARARETYQTTPDEVRLWQQVLGQLQRQAGTPTYALLKQTQLLTTNDGIALIGVANQLSMRWMRGRLGPELVTSFARCGHPVEAIQVVHLPSEQAETAA